MNQWKWLLISLGLVAAASVGLVGCGEDEKKACSSDSDCGDGEVCSSDTGMCEKSCTTANEECDDEAGELCGDVCGKTPAFCFIPCHGDGDCAEGQHCDLTFCGTRGGLCAQNKGCTTDTDCTNGQVCEATPGTTTSSCVDKCAADTDCAAGTACNTTTGHCIAFGAACTADTDCGTGNVCTNGVCEPAPTDACNDQDTCYARGNEYCAATESGTNVCTDNSCGVSFNSCNQCSSGPNGGNRDTGGPEIFGASQTVIGSGRNCKNDVSPSACQPDAPIRCEFSFFAFSPAESDLPTTGLNNAITIITPKNVRTHPFGAKKGSSGGLTTYSFSICVSEGNTTPRTAPFITSVSGKNSNTVCAVGTK